MIHSPHILPGDLLDLFLQNWETSLSNNSEEIPSYTEIFEFKNDWKVLSRTQNQVEEKKDPSLHSEIIAIQEAKLLKNTKYLDNCLLLTSWEPCIQCAGAIIRSRIPHLYFILPQRLGLGITSLPIEMIYELNYFPNIKQISIPHSQDPFQSFFQSKR